MRSEDRLEMSASTRVEAETKVEQHRDRDVPRIVSISDLAAEAIEVEREAEEREKEKTGLEHEQLKLEIGKNVDGAVGRDESDALSLSPLTCPDLLALPRPVGDSSDDPGFESEFSDADAGVAIPQRQSQRSKGKNLGVSGSRSRRHGEADDYFPSVSVSRLRHEIRAPNASSHTRTHDDDEDGSETGTGTGMGWPERSGLTPGQFTPLVPSPPTPASASASGGSYGAKLCACTICVRAAKQEQDCEEEQPPMPPPKDAKWLEQTLTPGPSGAGVDDGVGKEDEENSPTSTISSKANWEKLRNAVKDGSAVKRVLEARETEGTRLEPEPGTTSIDTCFMHRQLSWEPRHVDVLSSLPPGSNANAVTSQEQESTGSLAMGAAHSEQESELESDLLQKPEFNVNAGNTVNACMGQRQNSWEPAGKRMI